MFRKADYDGYLTALAMPTSRARLDAIALRAFNAEMAIIQDAVTQTELGQMRLAWWRTVIDDIFQVCVAVATIVSLTNYLFVEQTSQTSSGN